MIRGFIGGFIGARDVKGRAPIGNPLKRLVGPPGLEPGTRPL